MVLLVPEEDEVVDEAEAVAVVVVVEAFEDAAAVAVEAVVVVVAEAEAVDVDGMFSDRIVLCAADVVVSASSCV